MFQALLIVVLLLLSVVPAAQAEPAARVPQRPTKVAGSEILLELDRRLNLSEEQQARLMRMKEAFQNKHADELRRLRDEVLRVRTRLEEARKLKDRPGLVKARNEVRALRDEGEKLRQQFETELLGILTSAQKAEYEKLKKDGMRTRKLVPIKP